MILILSVGLGTSMPAHAGITAPSIMAPTPSYIPILLKGMTIHTENPLQFDFIIDAGDETTSPEALQEQAQQLIRYFMASLTIPQEDLWVNLSPHEDDRIIPDSLNETELGNTLLAQDYLLKQLTASLLHPEGEIGKVFWDKVYAEAFKRFGTTDIPVDTFNKVWITPHEAVVHEHEQTVYVVDAKMKVMMERDYVAAQESHNVIKSQSHNKKGVIPAKAGISADSRLRGNDDYDRMTYDFMTVNHDEDDLSSEIMRQVIIPAIEKEVNEGIHFAPLRQVVYALVLAKWYKKNLKESVLSHYYANQNKTAGIDLNDPASRDTIYAQYIKTYHEGVYDFIRDEVTKDKGQMTNDHSAKPNGKSMVNGYPSLVSEGNVVPRRYFSGGFTDKAMTIRPPHHAQEARDGVHGDQYHVRAQLDRAMTTAILFEEITLEGDETDNEQSMTAQRAREIIDETGNVVFIQHDDDTEFNDSSAVQGLLRTKPGYSAYQIHLKDYDLDRLTITNLENRIGKVIPNQGRVVLVVHQIERLINSTNLMEKLINHPNIILMGSTTFSGYREIEKNGYWSPKLNFLISDSVSGKRISEKRIAVIGASGFLGEKIHDSLLKAVPDASKILGTAFNNPHRFDVLDVTDPDAIQQYFQTHDVDVVIYAAGEAEADKAERQEERARARQLNATAVAEIGKHFNGKFVYISSEYVFDGNPEDGSGPYRTLSKAKPLNYYGETKLEGEQLTLDHFSEPIILRIGALYGYNHADDKNHSVKQIITKLRDGEDINVDTWQIKRPILIEDVAWTIIKLIAHDADGIFHTNGFEPMNKLQMARAIAEAYYYIFPNARRVKITGVEAARGIEKPQNTHMVNSDSPRPFASGIREMLAQMPSEQIEPKNQVLDDEGIFFSPVTGNVVLQVIQRAIQDGDLKPDNLRSHQHVTGQVTPFPESFVTEFPADKQYERLQKKGLKLSTAVTYSMGGVSATVGTQMNLGFSIRLPQLIPGDYSVPEWRLANLRSYNDDNPDYFKPAIVMTSGWTQAGFDALRADTDNFGFPDGHLFTLVNRLQPALAWNPNMPSQLGQIAYSRDGKPIMYPAGHFDFLRELVVSGLLGQLSRQGVQFISHFNMYNFGARVDDDYHVLIGVLAEKVEEARKKGRPLPVTLIEVVERDKDRPGTYPALVNGKFSLLRPNAMPEGMDSSDFSLFNTGSYHFCVEALLLKLGFGSNYDKSGSLSSEQIAARFDEVFDSDIRLLKRVVQDGPMTHSVLQVQRSLDDAVTQVPSAVIRVPKRRLFNVKTRETVSSKREGLLELVSNDVRAMSVSRVNPPADIETVRVAMERFISFSPYVRDQPWGGRYLVYLKALSMYGEGTPASESIEISSHPDFPLRMQLPEGGSLTHADIVTHGFEEDFYGKRVVETYGAGFPFMIRLLDAQKRLSIQVHPTDEVAQKFEGKDNVRARGKGEVFFVTGAEPDNEMWLGLKEGVDEKDFKRALLDQDPRIEDMLHKMSVQVGDIIRIPEGTIHGFIRGIRVIEMSHSSDITYRLWDFNRAERYPETHGYRKVHPEESLASINFDLLRGEALEASLRTRWEKVEDFSNNAGRREVAEHIAPDFYADRFVFEGLGENGPVDIKPVPISVSANGRFHALTVLKGAVIVRRKSDGSERQLAAGSTFVVPASLGDYEIIQDSHLPTTVYRFYPRFKDEYPQVNISISLGGSKFVLGAVRDDGTVLADTEINWREHFSGRPPNSLQVEVFLARQISYIMNRFSISPAQVGQIGIAVPGPVNYLTRRISTTYLPFDNYPLMKNLENWFYRKYEYNIRATGVLDVLVDVMGEIKHKKGALNGKENGLVLNLATGVAAGVLKDGVILDRAVYQTGKTDEFEIETGFAQIGRHLVRKNQMSKKWFYRPTVDGRVPALAEQEERLSQVYGGPNMAQRFVNMVIGGASSGKLNENYFKELPIFEDYRILSLEEILAVLKNRDQDPVAVQLEAQILNYMTRKAYNGDKHALSFLKNAANGLGRATATFIQAYPHIFNVNDSDWDIVLVGSLGEKLGNKFRADPRHQFSKKDLFIDPFQLGLIEAGLDPAHRVHVQRSQVESLGPREREVVAFLAEPEDTKLLEQLGIASVFDSKRITNGNGHSHASSDGAMTVGATPGGIDLNNMPVAETGENIVEFNVDDAMVAEMLNDPESGLMPNILFIRLIPDPLLLLGLHQDQPALPPQRQNFVATI